MNYRVAALCRAPLGAAFRLAGVDVIDVTDGASALQKLNELNRQSDLGIVLMEQELIAQLTSENQQALGRDALPIVVPFPARLWAEQPSSAEAYISEILRQAIGYRVRLR